MHRHTSEQDLDLRAIAVRLRKLGVAREVVVEALQIPKWTIAGWLAHDTLKHRRRHVA